MTTEEEYLPEIKQQLQQIISSSKIEKLKSLENGTYDHYLQLFIEFIDLHIDLMKKIEKELLSTEEK